MKKQKNSVRSRGFLAQLAKNESGNALAIMTAAMIPLIGMVGGALDISRIYLTRTKLQTACDAGVLAARQQASGTLSADNRTRGTQFFNFNFPAGTMGSNNTTFTLTQNATNTQRVDGTAATRIPATLMRVFGQENFNVSVRCDAERDIGHNDVMVVIDVTGSMLCDTGSNCTANNSASGVARFSGQAMTEPTIPSTSKIANLRTGISGLYNAVISSDPSVVTRYGIVPYSMTVNVGHLLLPVHLKQTTRYTYGSNSADINIQNTKWRVNGSDVEGSLTNWQNQAANSACVEERQSIQSPARSDGKANTTITNADIDTFASSRSDTSLQFGLYQFPPVNSAGTALFDQGGNNTQIACPAKASALRTYASVTDFNIAITDATRRVSGGTYHDTGMIWGARLLSPSGFRSAENPRTRPDSQGTQFPVNRHIVFLTDGLLDASIDTYTMYGIQRSSRRLVTGQNTDTAYTNALKTRFTNICNQIKSSGVTIWVIAYDVPNSTDISSCATSAGHYFTANSSNLQTVFSNIGRGIGDLRLAQ